ncbi:Uma2 family endonuclease [Streptomyces sp. TS71-3]|uniref:Uma2 family endonuclease n=1 Tax=Streptomyces sp. TS71-3 TaxID=2733862 RepID=UPI001B0F50C1|nr:Uma2 family endonuclease [Streptomyces sp. TS71-3]GHJ34998.1 hypothetical protein Sm713_06070 [Streptomyces sp. TS71-3]
MAIQGNAASQARAPWRGRGEARPPSAVAPPKVTIEEFEQIARTSPETVRLEFLNGRIEVKAVPDGNHREIVMWLLEQCMRHRTDLRLYSEAGLKVGHHPRGRARPDGTLAPRRHFTGTGEWVEPGGVLMVVEVTSRAPDTNRRDRVEKPAGYAAAGIPVYLLVDRDTASVVVHAEPEDGRYRSITSRAYGTAVDLPQPVGFTLDTNELKEFAD